MTEPARDDEEPDESDAALDEPEIDEDPGDDDEDPYDEEPISGRTWIEISATSMSRAYAMEIFGRDGVTGTVLRVTTWGVEAEFASPILFLPGITVKDLKRTSKGSK